MAVSGLIDTGAILAVLNPDDVWHVACREAFKTLPLPLLTSEAVLTEVFHLAARRGHDVETPWGFVHSGAVAMAAIEGSELGGVHRLMSQYADRPMDFADATLVYLAERETLSLVFTIDHADFQTYRIGGKQTFRIVPQERP